jgi:hypothetical protein
MVVSFVDGLLDLLEGYHYFIWVHMSEVFAFPFFCHLPNSSGADLDWSFRVTLVMLVSLLPLLDSWLGMD